MFHDIRNYIDGAWSAPQSGLYLDNVQPRSGRVFGRSPDSGTEDVDHAVTAAMRAFPDWKARPPRERSAVLLRIAAGIEARLDAFAEAESEDQGKPLLLARQLDIPRAVENFRFFAGAILHQEERAFQMHDLAFNYTRREPLGVAGLIAPWNLPLYLLTWKIAPALASGNTAVAKPSELTPLTAHLLSEVMQEAGVPRGVCNIVYGRGPRAGAALVAHPSVPLLSFTGGTATAATIARAAAPLFKKLSLELGGKNPALIFRDCDLEAAVATTLRSSLLNQGEICLCTSRILVEQDIYDRFTQSFLEGVRSLRVGDPRAPETFMGALVSREHREKVHGFVERAQAQGLTCLHGGHPLPLAGELRDGFFYAPTVLEAPDSRAEIMQQEVFGPVVTITPFRTFEEAITLANSTAYGLAATVWTSNIHTAHRAAAAIQAGQVWVNTWLLRDLRVPFGGMKNSGLGREGGVDSLDFFTEQKTICLQLNPAGP